MENGKAKQLLDRIQDIVGDGQNVPFAAGMPGVDFRSVFCRFAQIRRVAAWSAYFLSVDWI